MQVFKIPGVEPVLMNTVRHAILRDIRTWAFPVDSVVVHRLVSSSLEPDFVRLRVSTIPVPQHGGGNLVMECDVTNRMPEPIHITTSDCTYKNGINPFLKAIRICTLERGETLSLTASTKNATPSEGSLMHTPCSRCFIHHDGTFCIQPRMGYSGKDLLLEAIKVVESQMAALPALTPDTEEGTITFPTPIILADYMRRHVSVKMAAVRSERLLEAKGSLEYALHPRIELPVVLKDVQRHILADLEDLRSKI